MKTHDFNSLFKRICLRCNRQKSAYIYFKPDGNVALGGNLEAAKVLGEAMKLFFDKMNAHLVKSGLVTPGGDPLHSPQVVHPILPVSNPGKDTENPPIPAHEAPGSAPESP